MNSIRKRKVEYCDILGVGLDADENEVKQAYKRLAMELHPDRPNNKDHQEESGKKFQEVTEAYEKLHENTLLMNQLKNNLHSTDIANSLDSLFMGNHIGTGKSSILTPNVDSKLMNCVGAGISYKSQIKSSPKRGQSLKAVLKLGKEESETGCVKNIEYTRSLNCESCSGSGNSKNKPKTCTECDGKGLKITQINGKTLGSNNITTICRKCHSTGFLLSKDCLNCNGTGKKCIKKTQSVHVPPRSITGGKLVFEGEGDEGLDGGPTGDLILWFEVEGTPFVEIPPREVKKRGRKPGSGRKKILSPLDYNLPILRPQTAS